MDGVLEDVLDNLVVLLPRLDRLGPEASAEDVMLSGVSVVECAGVLTVQVAHAVRQVRHRRLDQQVVVVAEQTLRVEPPAVALAHPVQDAREDGAVGVVAEDRLVVVPLRDDVVVRTVFEMAERSAHCGDGSVGASRRTAASAF
jgi:hypothetical protein